MGSNPRIEPPYDVGPDHTVLLARFREAAAAWRGADGRVVLCREIHYPSDYPGPDGLPLAEVVASHPLMSGRDDAEFYPDLVELGDLVMRKTGFSAVATGNLLEILDEHGWDTVVMGGLTTPICVGTTADGLSMAGVRVVVLEDACASQSFEGSRPRRRMRSRWPASATSSAGR